MEDTPQKGRPESLWRRGNADVYQGQGDMVKMQVRVGPRCPASTRARRDLASGWTRTRARPGRLHHPLLAELLDLVLVIAHHLTQDRFRMLTQER